MWSINLFMNKLMKAIEENLDASAENHFNFVDSYSIQQSPNNQNITSISSHFVEVSLRLLSMPFDIKSILECCCHLVTYCYISKFVYWIHLLISFEFCASILGTSHKSAKHMGLWPCLCSYGFASSRCLWLYYRRTSGALLYYKVPSL